LARLVLLEPLALRDLLALTVPVDQLEPMGPLVPPVLLVPPEPMGQPGLPELTALLEPLVLPVPMVLPVPLGPLATLVLLDHREPTEHLGLLATPVLPAQRVPIPQFLGRLVLLAQLVLLARRSPSRVRFPLVRQDSVARPPAKAGSLRTTVISGSGTARRGLTLGRSLVRLVLRGLRVPLAQLVQIPRFLVPLATLVLLVHPGLWVRQARQGHLAHRVSLVTLAQLVLTPQSLVLLGHLVLQDRADPSETLVPLVPQVHLVLPEQMEPLVLQVPLVPLVPQEPTEQPVPQGHLVPLGPMVLLVRVDLQAPMEQRVPLGQMEPMDLLVQVGLQGPMVLRVLQGPQEPTGRRVQPEPLAQLEPQVRLVRLTS